MATSCRITNICHENYRQIKMLYMITCLNTLDLLYNTSNCIFFIDEYVRERVICTILYLINSWLHGSQYYFNKPPP
jgi:hypothetical protein